MTTIFEPSDDFPSKRGLGRGQLQTAGNFKIIVRRLYGEIRAILICCLMKINRNHGISSNAFFNRFPIPQIKFELS